MVNIQSQLLDALAKGCPHISGTRLNHARGVLASGTFVATPEAAAITVAAHMQGLAVPLLVRFSNFTGDPNIADNDPRANPRGIAVRFSPVDSASVDLVGHAVDGFPAANPKEFLEFLRAANMASEAPEAFERYLDQHAAAKRFIRMIPATPRSYVGECYFGLHALAYLATDGCRTVGRAQIVPVEGSLRLSADEAAKRSTDFLKQGIRRLIADAPVHMKLLLQVAEREDRLDDISTPWPEGRRLITLGLLKLDRVIADEDQQSLLAFDPANLATGIESVGDPMLPMRSAAYRLAYKRRKNATLTVSHRTEA